MSIRNLDKIFRPERIAVVGASRDPSSVGATVLRNLIGAGFQGVVYPVNPKYESVHGIQAFPNVAGLPKTPDVAILCTPAATTPKLVRECGEAGIRGVIIVSAGFRETGEAGRRLEQQIAEEARKFDGMRVVGPNCLGIMASGRRLNASFAAAMPREGTVAFISQSGALCASVLDWALHEEIGFSYFVSIGNMLDVDFGDLIDYFGEDPGTSAIILYMESIREVREFMSAARNFAKTKPIVAYKAGRFAESAKAASSHTGALAGEDAVYDAAMQRAGIVRVFQMDDMFDCAELLARQRLPRGPNLAIITNAGGPGVMATDALIARHGLLAQLSQQTLAKLDEVLPAFWSHGNPIDILGDAAPERFRLSTEAALGDPGVDAVLLILTPQAMTDPTATARAIGELASHSTKPILAAWMGGQTVHAGIRVLNRARVPTYSTAEQAVQAFMYLVSYARNLDILYDTPRSMPVSFASSRQQLQGLLRTIPTNSQAILSEITSKTLLAAYEIPVTTPHSAESVDRAIQIAREIGYPVALKIHSPDISHKTEVKGVSLDLYTDEEVRSAFNRIVETARQLRPQAKLEGVTVQRMVRAKEGLELIIGAKKDPTFGAVLMIGLGGITAEVLSDRALGLPPLDERLARRMCESLRSWPLLQGYRGRPGVHLDRLIEVLMRVSYLIADYPQIKELDMNPVLATPEEVTVLDARIVLDQAVLDHPVRPYSHLAIRPYPEEFIMRVQLKDGTPVTLRPIQPADEPLWHEMLATCSEETIHLRFGYLFKYTTHEMATRYCFVDYDREMAIVAEAGGNGARQLIGVGRLVADPDHDTAEYAVLVADPWQGRGAGGHLTDYCLEIAKTWGVKRVIAQTLAENSRMLAMFQKRDFHLEHNPDEGLMMVRKDLR